MEIQVLNATEYRNVLCSCCTNPRPTRVVSLTRRSCWSLPRASAPTAFCRHPDSSSIPSNCVA